MEPDDKKKQALRTLMLDKEVDIELEDITPPAFNPILSVPTPTVKLSTESRIEKLVQAIEEQKNEKILQVEEQPVIESNFSYENEVFNEHLSDNVEQIKIEAETQQKPTKSKKFRYKLIAIGYALVLAICIGWTIGNAIAINNQAGALTTASTSYEINVVKYTMKIAQLDGIEVSDSADEFSPITSGFELQPEPLQHPTDYTTSTNWFDKLCNWLSKLFRR